MELKANELRLNNYYELKGSVLGGGVCQIKKINDFIHIGNLIESDLVKPIPLTEEWLLKFGFKHSGNGFFIHTESLLELANIGNDFFLAGIKGISLNTIYYTHQLQNLYFALTNKELEIKM